MLDWFKRNPLPNKKILDWYMPNPLPNNKTLDWLKLKPFADKKVTVAAKLKYCLRNVENIFGKGFFFQSLICFPKNSFQ